MTSYRDRLATSAPRPAVPLRPFRTPVRGHPFAAPPPGVGPPIAGQVAQLEREPANPADPLAVAVWAADGGRWWRVGYLDRGVAARLAPRLDRGLRIDARIDGWVPEPEGRWRRPVVLLLPAGSSAPLAGPGDGPRVGDGSRVGDWPRVGDGPRGTLAAEERPSTRLWGRPPGAVTRPVRTARRR
jgi:hypothetical protein